MSVKKSTGKVSAVDTAKKTAASKSVASKNSAQKLGKASYSHSSASSQISYDKAWRKIETSPYLAKAKTPACMLATDLLLRTINASYFRACGRLWSCQARAITDKNLHAQKDAPLEKHAVAITLGGAEYLLEADLPVEMRQVLEKMTEPFQLEEIPNAIALAIVSLRLKPILQELLALSPKVKDFVFATGQDSENAFAQGIRQGIRQETRQETRQAGRQPYSKASSKVSSKMFGKNGESLEKWLQQLDLSLEIKALPINEQEQSASEQPENQSANSSANSLAKPLANPLEKPLTLRLHLHHTSAQNLCSALKPAQSRLRYPPNLHVAWNFYTESTTISIKEMRELEEGDVLLLA